MAIHFPLLPFRPRDRRRHAVAHIHFATRVIHTHADMDISAVATLFEAQPRAKADRLSYIWVGWKCLRELRGSHGSDNTGRDISDADGKTPPAILLPQFSAVTCIEDCRGHVPPRRNLPNCALAEVDVRRFRNGRPQLAKAHAGE